MFILTTLRHIRMLSVTGSHRKLLPIQFRSMSETVGIIFDFDDTLAPDSTSGFLASIGVEPAHFWRERVQPLLDDDWDPIPAYLHMMIAESNARPANDRITHNKLEAFGRTIIFFDGVEAMFDTLRATVREIDPTLNVEFYLISSGIGAILRSTSIAPQFADIWACDFATDEAGAIIAAKNVVSFTEKTKYLYKISKGLIGPGSRGKPFDVNDRTRKFRILFEHMVFVGDGQTDVPCFALIDRYGGVPLGVYDANRPSKWGKTFGLVRDKRVSGLYSANFTQGSDLHNTLVMSVRDIAGRIAATV